MRQAGRPTLPTTLASENACNPFLRIDSPAVRAAVAAGWAARRRTASRPSPNCGGGRTGSTRMSRACLPAWPLWLALLPVRPCAEPPPPASPASAPARPRCRRAIPLDSRRSLPCQGTKRPGNLPAFPRRPGRSGPAMPGRQQRSAGANIQPCTRRLAARRRPPAAVRLRGRRAARGHLPTEYALIPFVESGYKPGARSPSGPGRPVAVHRRHRAQPQGGDPRGYDGRLSPVDSTRPRCAT
jgi:hypothetical protein